MIDQFMQRNDSTKVRFPVLDNAGQAVNPALFVQGLYTVSTLAGEMLWQGRLGNELIAEGDLFVAMIPGIDYVGSLRHECRLWLADGATQTPINVLMSIVDTTISPTQPT